jgi:hypothetical protein
MSTSKQHALRLSRRGFVALAAAGAASGMLGAGGVAAQTGGGTLVCPINQDLDCAPSGGQF